MTLLPLETPLELMSRTLRVLLIDDNPDDRILTIRELKQEFDDLEVEQIVDSQTFVQALELGNFDLVTTDYQLIWTNGIQILRAVKESYPERPVIMFTNTGTQEVAVDAMKMGLDDYIIKSARHYVRLKVAVHTALKRAEERQASILLNSRLQSLLNRLNVGVFRATVEGHLLEANTALLRLLGVESLEPKTVNLNEYALQIRASSQDKPWEREVQLQRADGSTLWVLLNETVDQTNGKVLVDGLVENITARKQAEIEIQQLNATLEQRVVERTAKLEEANTELESFAYSVSHDLREPLRTIHGFANALSEDYGNQLSPTGNHYLQRIMAATQNLDGLIQNLLIYSRLSRDEILLQPIALSAVVQGSLAQLQNNIQSRNALVDVQESLPIAIANYYTLVQVVSNLLTNAIKFVEPNVQPQIRVWAEEGGETIRLWVQDNGIGVAPENHQRIFQTFVRLQGADFYSGNGIGLAIARKGVERMGGTVGVEAQLGEGSRFWIELPRFRRTE